MRARSACRPSDALVKLYLCLSVPRAFTLTKTQISPANRLSMCILAPPFLQTRVRAAALWLNKINAFSSVYRFACLPACLMPAHRVHDQIQHVILFFVSPFLQLQLLRNRDLFQQNFCAFKKYFYSSKQLQRIRHFFVKALNAYFVNYLAITKVL